MLFVCTDITITWSGIHNGFGRHIELYGLEGVRHSYLGLFVYEILYPITLYLTKFSILLFYLRLFGKNTNIRLPVMILGSIISAWILAVVLTKVHVKETKLNAT